MAIITDDRSALDDALGDDRATLLVLVGEPPSSAGQVHDCAEGERPDCGEGITDDWRYTFLVTDPDILTPAERQEWFRLGDPGDGPAPDADPEPVSVYAILDRTSGRTCRDELSALMLNDEPSIIKIKLAFAACEAGADGT